MVEPHFLANVVSDNQRSLTRLSRVIAKSEGRFDLIAVRCNHTHLQTLILQELRNQCLVKVRVLVLPVSAKTLYTTILAELTEEQPSALMILGLESVDTIDDLLIATNQVRDEFRNSFPFPLVLCLTDEVLQKLAWLAPDFNNWLQTLITFALNTDQPIDLAQKIR